MTTAYQRYHRVGQVGLFIALILALAALAGWPAAGPALAQSPDEQGAEETTPEATPPDVEDLGEPVMDEAYTSSADTTDEEGGVIDIFDLSFVAARYGSTNPAADINGDGQVDIFDLSMLAAGFNQAAPPAEAQAAVVTPTPLPVVESGQDFGTLDLVVEEPVESADVEASAVWRPLRLGVGIDFARVYDPMDGQTNSPPDLYAVVSAGNVPARTATWWNSYDIMPRWRLGWWRYNNFPRTTTGDGSSLPIRLELRDDDGRVCYGYYGCRDQFEWPDISQRLYQRVKTLTFYPSSCKVVDEAGVTTTGTWLDANRCQVPLQSWGTEWPRGYVAYFIDSVWN